MNILILTIGQSDLQLVKKDKYFPVKKYLLKSLQEKLKILLKDNQLEWSPISLLTEKKRGKVDIDINSINIITFPLIENIFIYFKEQNINIDEIYIFYTNRQHLKEIKKEYLDSEPYLSSEIFSNFEKEIFEYYKINSKVKYINIGEKISNIKVEKVYPFLGKHFEYIYNDEVNKLYIAVAGGLPIVRGVIENLGTLYFPQNSIILSQERGDVTISKNHLYQNYYRNYNLLRESIKNWDFIKAFDIYKKMGNSTTMTFHLLNIAKNLLYTNKKETKNINNLLDNINTNNKENFQKIISVLNNDKNFSFIIFLRFLQVFKQNNYWGATIILISLFEIFIEETISFYYKESIQQIMYEDGKVFKYFKWKNINPNWNPEVKKEIFKNKEKKILKNNWIAIEEILTNILPKDKKEIFKFIEKNILRDSRKLRTMRNDFIHHGKPIDKEELTGLLKIDKSENEIFFKSSILNSIFVELKKQNENYFNWLEFFEEILLKEIKTLKPLF